MSKILKFGGEVFWMVIYVFFGLAVGLFLLHLVRNHVGGIVGTVAGDIEGAVTPGGN